MRYKKRWAPIGSIAIEPSLAKASDEITELAGELGYAYIDNFYPGHEPNQRLVYTGSDFSDAVKEMKQKQWDEAIEILLTLAESPDQKLAKKAAYNLSLCMDATGQTSDAEFWRYKAE